MYHSTIGKPKQIDGHLCFVSSQGEAGRVVYGPYETLTPGSYSVEFRVMPHELGADDEPCCIIDVFRRGTAIVAEKDFTASELARRNGVVHLRFEVLLPDIYEYRVTATGLSGLTVHYKRPIRRIEDPAKVFEPPPAEP